MNRSAAFKEFKNFREKSGEKKLATTFTDKKKRVVIMKSTVEINLKQKEESNSLSPKKFYKTIYYCLLIQLDTYKGRSMD